MSIGHPVTNATNVPFTWRRIALCTFLVLLTKAVVGAIAFGLVLSDMGEGGAAFRAEETEQHGLAMAGYVAWSFAFTILFARAFEQHGGREGLRFGLLVWLLYFVPMALGIHAYFAVSAAWSAFGVASGLAESLACGSVAGLVLRRASAPRAAVARAGS